MDLEVATIFVGRADGVAEITDIIDIMIFSFFSHKLTRPDPSPGNHLCIQIFFSLLSEYPKFLFSPCLQTLSALKKKKKASFSLKSYLGLYESCHLPRRNQSRNLGTCWLSKHYMNL